MKQYTRKEGFGIRDYTLVLPLTSCMSDTARKLAEKELLNYIWHPHGCDLLESDLEYYAKQLEAVVSHPNIGRIIALTMNCVPIARSRIERAAEGKSIDFINYHDFMDEAPILARSLPIYSDSSVESDRPITVGVKCGGSTKEVIERVNPEMGKYCDMLIDCGGTVIIGENWEFLGAIKELKARAVDIHAADQIEIMAMRLEDAFYDRYHKTAPAYSSEFSLGRFRKAGTKPIQGVLQVTEKPPRPGLWMLDGPNADMAGFSALAMSGCHAILYATGTGLPMGNALCPVYKWTPKDMNMNLEEPSLAEKDRHFEWQFHLKNMVW